MLETLLEENFLVLNLTNQDVDEKKRQRNIVANKLDENRGQLTCAEEVAGLTYAELNRELKILSDKLKESCDTLYDVKLSNECVKSRADSPSNEDPFIWDNELTYNNFAEKNSTLLLSPSSTIESYVSLRDVAKSMQVSEDYSYENVEEFLFGLDTDKQKMVEKICDLQKKIAQLNDDVDRLENHIDYLSFNLQQKTK